jgi:hypothetical protein
MKRISQRIVPLALCVSMLPVPALPWGSAGHIMVNRIGAERLPASLPAFVRSRQAIDEIASLGPEEDRLKGAGTSWDGDSDQAHFLDIDDNGLVAGVVSLSALPPDMERYAAALAPAHTTPYRQGYLPYAIMDGFERVRKDFAIWRVDNYLATHALTPDARVRYASDRALRETLTLRDIGVWGHFVADGSQPLHVTVHYNGWGDYENPKNYTTSHTVHATFESTFVSAHVTADAVRARVAPYAPAKVEHLQTQDEIAARVGQYLAGSAKGVPALYDLWTANGFAEATPQAVAFTAQQLARGAAMYTTLIALAWDDSINESVGYPPVPVRDILAGKVAPRDPAD